MFPPIAGERTPFVVGSFGFPIQPRPVVCRGGPRRREAAGRHTRVLQLPCSKQFHCTNSNHYGSGYPMQITLRYPTVTCPGCKRPMMPSPPLPVSEDTDLCDVTYTCEDCGATTTRIIKIEK
jgi:RNase P subunit RPR2